MTRGIAALCDNPGFYILVVSCLNKHISGDWGDVCAEDKATNDQALKDGDRVLSAYKVGDVKIWIITEYDRSYTTILLPEEY
jgi:hypothetical protein